MCDALRELLREAVDSGGGGGLMPFGSVPCRVVAALYMLLLNHPVDRRGRCRSCRRPGAVLGRRWRRCRVHGEAALWLNQPTDFVVSHLIRELGLTGGDARAGEAMAAPGLDDTDVVPRMTADPGDPPTTSQSPVVSSPPFPPGGFPGAGRPDLDHGGAGESPEGRWPRRGPSGDAGAAVSPVSGGSLLVSRGAA